MFGFRRIGHERHAGGKLRLALEDGAAEHEDFAQHAADSRGEAAGRFKRDRRFCRRLVGVAAECQVSGRWAMPAITGDGPNLPALFGRGCSGGGRVDAPQCCPGISQRPAGRPPERVQHFRQAGRSAGRTPAAPAGLGIESEIRWLGSRCATGGSGNGVCGLAFPPWPLTCRFRLGYRSDRFYEFRGQWGYCRQGHRVSRYRPCYAADESSLTGRI